MSDTVPRVAKTLVGSSTLRRLLAQAQYPVKSMVASCLPMAHQGVLRLAALLPQHPWHPPPVHPRCRLLRLKHLP